jgi:hypothetical protein
VAGGTEVPALAGKDQQIFMAAVLAFDSCKAVMRVAAVEIQVNDLLQIRPPEAVMPGELIVIDLDEGLKMVLYAAVIIRILRVSGAINSSRKRHDISPSRLSCRHNVEPARRGRGASGKQAPRG